jgi:hypothetical protein
MLGNHLGEEGFEGVYCQLDGLHSLKDYGGAILGMPAMDFPHLKITHVVAVDELGVVDPPDNAPFTLLYRIMCKAESRTAWHSCGVLRWAAVLGVAAGTRAPAARLRR